MSFVSDLEDDRMLYHQTKRMINSPIHNALELPSGARMIRCALQVNPHEYAKQYRGEEPAMDEGEYNRLLAERCVDHGIEAVGITHHNHVDHIDAMSEALTERGITVFPGFELKSQEDVHVLCLYEPGTPQQLVRSYLSEFGIHDSASNTQHANKTFADLLDVVQNTQKGLCIAAHATNSGGILRALSPGARINAWKDKNLLAIQIPGSEEDLPADLRPIVQNRNADYKRPTAPAKDLAVAVVNARDVKHPDDLAQPGATTRIKMASISIEGLRQAFLDPESRIVLNSADKETLPDLRIEAIAWGGGFLADQALHFHDALNVLIGGRGTGKSTVVESLRYVFEMEPLGEEARGTHRQIIKSVLGSGSRIWVKVQASRPNPRAYLIERGYGEEPVVRSEDGEVIRLRPADLIADLQIYGQHEIAELTRDKTRQTDLIRCFVTSENDFDVRKETLRQSLRKNRHSLVDARNELDRIEERLGALPGIEETLKSFKNAGLEEKLKHQSLLVREETCLKNVERKLEPFEEVLGLLTEALPVDTTLVSEEALKDLPNRELLGKAREILSRLNGGATEAMRQLNATIDTAKAEVGSLREEWETAKSDSKAEYEQTLRELHREKIDGAEFVRLRQRIEDLKPLKTKKDQFQKMFDSLLEQRRKLLIEWDGLLSEEFLELQRAAKSASRKLRGQVKLEVERNGDRTSLIAFLDEKMTGRKDQIRRAFEQADFSLRAFADALLAGSTRLQEEYSVSAAQAEGLAQLPLDIKLEFAEIEMMTITEVSLNVAAEAQPEEWKRLHELSKGQKATALLLLLLLESKSPLIIDQPEDDLDNRFVTSGVVPRIRVAKRDRQFIFATHNANIPVLGDAELIAVLSASGEAGDGQGYLNPDDMGAIDTPRVKSLIEDLLEGGHTAFESRRKKYRF